ALTSWPDCFALLPDCKGVLTQGFIPQTEFGVGTCYNLPSYSSYDPEGNLFAVVAFSGNNIEGRVVTFGFPPSGLYNTKLAKQLAKNCILFCSASIPSIYVVEVEPSNLTPLIDEFVTFDGLVTDTLGHPISGIKVYVEDPIKEITTWTTTGFDGKFSYSTKAIRAGEFTFIFYVNSIPTKCTIYVQPLDVIWPGQVLYAKNPTDSDPYEISVYVNGNLEGVWIIEPGEQKVLWKPLDPFGFYSINVGYKNLATQEQWNAHINPYLSYQNPYIPYCSAIPPNSKMSDYYIQGTSFFDMSYAQSTIPYIIKGNDEPVSSKQEDTNGPIKVEIGTEVGPSVGLEPHVGAGCEVFVGGKVECSIGCSVGTGLEVSFCAGAGIPILPFAELCCGLSCSVTVAEASCSAGASASAQAGYSASGGIDITTKSPVRILVTDPLGRQAGYISEINYKTKLIPGATYYEGTDQQTVSIPNALVGDYEILIIGTDDGFYTLEVTRTIHGEVVYSQSYYQAISKGEIHKSTITLSESEGIITVTVEEPSPTIVDNVPPTTSLEIGEPKYADSTGNIYVSFATPFSLVAEDNLGGSGVASIFYRIYNSTYDTGLMNYVEPFLLVGLSDGQYSIDYYSIDNAGNVEPTNTITVTLDNTPPSTTLTISEPKYILDTVYVTADTRFTLEAVDAGSGIFSTAYRIFNSNYDSGWQTYAEPFNLAGLTDGTYTIEFNSADNLGNTEATNSVQVTLFSWSYIFEDSYGRGTTLKINLAHNFIQFITPDKDYDIRKATYMRQCGRAIIIQHCDSELRIITVAVDTKLDFCIAIAWDKQTHRQYFLIDKVGKG
ncbi:MAG: hypothetical protein QXQ61_01180, partial [Candidatus Bathyarchaeia archaeon]